MNGDPSGFDLEKPATEEAPVYQRQRRWPWVPVVAGAVLVFALAGAYMYLRTSPRQQPAAAPKVQWPAAGKPAEPGDQIQLPPLDQTDPVVRQLVGALSSHPTIASWLTTDGLILNFTVVTSRISNGESPAKELGTIGPVAAFRPGGSRDKLVVDPASYRRYDRYAQAVASLDARGTARL